VHVDLDTLATAPCVRIDAEVKASRSSTGGDRRSGSPEDHRRNLGNHDSLNDLQRSGEIFIGVF
jgi:hypothetical protein